MDVIGVLLYPMFSVIFVLINLIENIFYAFAGIGEVNVGGYSVFGIHSTGETVGIDEGGLVYYLLQSNLVQNLLLSMLVLALLLIVIFTTLAILKNMYSAKPKKWQEIISDAIKGLGMFIIIPVLCLLGVYLGNYLLQAINQATNPTGTSSMSGMLFKVSAYNANYIRLDENFTESDWETYKAIHIIFNLDKEFESAFGEKVTDENGNLKKEYYASLIDELYAKYPSLTYSQVTVGYCYSLSQFNYLLMVGGGAFMLYVLCALSFGMVKRLFMILILFIISPVMCSLYPIKGDGPAKSVTGDMVKQVISAYGAVAGMNLMFALLPVVQNISIPGVPDILGILPLLYTIAGLYLVNDIIGLLSNYIGADNAYASGKSLMGSVKGRASKMVGGALKVSAGAFGKASVAKKGNKMNTFFNTLAKSGIDAVTDPIIKGATGISIKDIKGAYSSAKGEAKDKAKSEEDINKYQQYHNCV